MSRHKHLDLSHLLEALFALLNKVVRDTEQVIETSGLILKKEATAATLIRDDVCKVHNSLHEILR